MRKQVGSISPRVTLLLVALLFFIPLTLAWLMYMGVIDFNPSRGVNHGTLIEPPVHAQSPQAFTSLDLNDRWVLAYPLPATCDDSCRDDLAGLRQFHRALGRDAGRVGIALVSLNEPGQGLLGEIERIDPGLLVISENTGMLLQQFEQLAGIEGVYVIDPLGNIMMHYPPGPDPGEILADMERLLQYATTDRR